MRFCLRSVGMAATALVFALLSQQSVDAAVVRFVSDPAIKTDLVIDVRPTAQCETGSLPGARCLPARDVFGPHGRPANISGLLWLLGTAGLTGAEHVMVVGDGSLDRDAMAGLLYVAGQRQVSVLKGPLRNLSSQGQALEPGIARSTTREAVYQAPMRGNAAILRAELLALIRSEAPPVILDGRRESDYWGATVRAPRGGHIPGAQHAAMAEWAGEAKPPLHVPASARPVVYGHDAREGLAFLARVVATGADARVYLGGWAGWASNGALPADSETHPARRAMVQGGAGAGRADGALPTLQLAAIAALAGLGFAGAGFVLGRRTAGRGEV